MLTGGEESFTGGYKIARQAKVDFSALGEKCMGKRVIAGSAGGFVGVGEVSGAGLDEHAEHLAGGEFSQIGTAGDGFGRYAFGGHIVAVASGCESAAAGVGGFDIVHGLTVVVAADVVRLGARQGHGPAEASADGYMQCGHRAARAPLRVDQPVKQQMPRVSVPHALDAALLVGLLLLDVGDAHLLVEELR